MRPARTHRAVLFVLGVLLGWLPLLSDAPARAQWGDSYDPQSGNGAYYQPPRRRSRDAYYRDDGTAARQPRYAPQQEAPRQFFWPWEDRPQQSAPRPSAPTGPRDRGPRPATPIRRGPHRW